MVKDPHVLVEGVIVPGGGEPDADGDLLDIEGARYQAFVESGYVTRLCAVAPKVDEIVGQPVAVERDGEDLRLRARVFDPSLQTLVRATARKDEGGRLRTEMGFALAGRIHKREGQRITDFEICHVAIVPVDKLTDPRCRCYLVGDGGGD
jgi:hypothetical protein